MFAMQFSRVRRRALARMACACGVFLGAICVAASAQTMRIGRTDAHSELTDRTAAVLRAAYRNLGINIVFVRLPLRRSLELANNGTIDGDVHRVREVGDAYKNLIRIEVPVDHYDLAAYAQKPCASLNEWSALRGRRIAFERGVIAAERTVGDMGAIEADHTEDVLHMLRKGMVDVGVLVDFEADIAIRRAGIKDICRMKPLTDRKLLYHYLNKRHTDVAKRLQDVLADMQARGEIEAILDRESKRLMGE